MDITVSLHLRPHDAPSNKKPRAIAAGLQAAGATIVTRSRADGVPANADLVLQAGFANSLALQTCIDHGIPYLIAEEPAYRHVGHVDVSYGYGGLMGGAFHTPAPQQERWKPPLGTLKVGGPTLLVGQKPNDHSLRGSDHIQWLTEMLVEYPEAEFRPHPLMVPADPLRESTADVLARVGSVVTYTSTMGTEALIEGCTVEAKHPLAQAYGVRDRESWLHELSWQNFPFDVAASAEIGRHILRGYEVAAMRADAGQQEVPRPKSTEQIVCYDIDDERVK